jgi:DNA (cytosine-5)-methyltransferase 1
VSKPRLLDLFSGAGGAARGYQQAGFYVVGVDINPQPRYAGDEFHQADAMTYPLEGFDAIHASPPCQHYSSATRERDKHPDLYAATRVRLLESGAPFVIENVIGAPYDHGIVLCGSMFALTADGEWLQRHRNFEADVLMFQPACAHKATPRPITVTGNAYVSEVREYKHSRQATFALAQKLMGIDWMTRDELAESIPPAYTEYIGKHLLEVSR